MLPDTEPHPAIVAMGDGAFLVAWEAARGDEALVEGTLVRCDAL